MSDQSLSCQWREGSNGGMAGGRCAQVLQLQHLSSSILKNIPMPHCDYPVRSPNLPQQPKGHLPSPSQPVRGKSSDSINTIINLYPKASKLDLPVFFQSFFAIDVTAKHILQIHSRASPNGRSAVKVFQLEGFPHRPFSLRPAQRKAASS